jgi:hypothetical protein
MQVGVGAYHLCRKCDSPGWITYRSETVEGEFEEAYQLCSNHCTPRYCMGSRLGRPVPCPGIVRHGLAYYSNDHIVLIRAGRDVDSLQKAINGLDDRPLSR